MKIKYLQLLLWPLLLLTACTKNEPVNVNVPGLSLFGSIMADKHLTLYQAALKRAGMLDTATFANGGPFTVFAPVDSAFINAGLTLDSINRYDPQALALVLRYAIVYGKISSSTLVGFYSQPVKSQHPTLQPEVTKNYYGFYFNGIPAVSDGSQTLADGVLHELKRVPIPQEGNLWDLVQRDPDLTLFLACVKHAGAPYVDYLKGTSPVLATSTVFAPVNDAYKKIGLGDTTTINAQDPYLMGNQLYNFFSGPALLFTANFIGGYSLNYQSVFISGDGFTIHSTGNVMPTHIVVPDLLTTNGVLQKVDQVFAP